MSLSTLKGNRTIHYGVFSNFLIIWIKICATRINFVPWLGSYSILCTHIPIGILTNDMQTHRKTKRPNCMGGNAYDFW